MLTANCEITRRLRSLPGCQTTSYLVLTHNKKKLDTPEGNAIYELSRTHSYFLFLCGHLTCKERKTSINCPPIDIKIIDAYLLAIVVVFICFHSFFSQYFLQNTPFACYPLLDQKKKKIKY